MAAALAVDVASSSRVGPESPDRPVFARPQNAIGRCDGGLPQVLCPVISPLQHRPRPGQKRPQLRSAGKIGTASLKVDQAGDRLDSGDAWSRQGPNPEEREPRCRQASLKGGKKK
jgi:hypothetical protein